MKYTKKILTSALALLTITGCTQKPANEPNDDKPIVDSALDDTTQNGSMTCKAVIDEVMAMDGLTLIGDNVWARGKDNIYTIDMQNQLISWKNWEGIYNGDSQTTYRYHVSNGRTSMVNSDGSDSYINLNDDDVFMVYEWEGLNEKFEKAGCPLSGKSEAEYLAYEDVNAADTSVINYSVFDWIFETKREDNEYRWVQNYLNKETKLEDSEFYHHLKNKEEADAFQPDDAVWCENMQVEGKPDCNIAAATSSNYVITTSHEALSEDYNTFEESQKRVKFKNGDPDNVEPQPRAIMEFVKDFVYPLSSQKVEEEFTDGSKEYWGPTVEVGFLYVDEPENESILQPFSTEKERNPYQEKMENGELKTKEEWDAWERASYETSFAIDYKNPKVYYPSNLFVRGLSETYNNAEHIYQINTNIEINKNSNLKVACDSLLIDLQSAAHWYLKDFTYAEDFTQNIANFYDFGWRMEHGLYELWGDQYGY